MALNRPVGRLSERPIDRPRSPLPDIDYLPADYRPPIPAPKTRAEFTAALVVPYTLTCQQVEGIRKLASWLIRVADDLGYTDIVKELHEWRTRFIQEHAACYAVE